MININSPFFSIIIPVYKVEDYLKECLDSVLEQTFSDYECILVDDGSPDNCPAICDEYSEKYNNFFVIHQDNKGLSEARNTGIRQAKGEYLIFLDSDDKLANNNVLTSLYIFIMNNTVSVIFCPCFARFSNMNSSPFPQFREQQKLTHTQLFEYVKNGGGLFAAWLFIVKRITLIDYKIYFRKDILHEDMEWIPRLLICNPELVCVYPSEFYLYRHRVGSITSRYTQKRIDSISVIISSLNSLVYDIQHEEFIDKWINFLCYQMFCNFVFIYFENHKLYEHNKNILQLIFKENKAHFSFRNKFIFFLSKIFSWTFLFHVYRILKK